jgi:hypothetical protein
MQVIAFIEPRQGDVIEKIVRHRDLWQPSTWPTPPSSDDWGDDPDDASDSPTTSFDEPARRANLVPAAEFG